MNANLRLQLANRIHLMLMRELGQGIDVAALLRQPVYARDVLLVCEALEGTDGPALARQFRAGAPVEPGPAPWKVSTGLAPHGTLSRRRSSPPSAT